MLRFIAGLLVVGLILLATAFAFGLIKMEQTGDARLPRIAIEKGTLPTYKADMIKVEVGTKNETVQVPTVDVQKPE